MLHLRCRVVRVLHADHQPPVVEAIFVDAHGVQHAVHDKETIFFEREVSLDVLPLEASMRCTRLTGNRITLGRPDGPPPSRDREAADPCPTTPNCN